MDKNRKMGKYINKVWVNPKVKQKEISFKYYSKPIIDFKFNPKSIKAIIFEKEKKKEYVFKGWKKDALDDAISDMYSTYSDRYEFTFKLIFAIKALKIIRNEDDFIELIDKLKSMYVSDLPKTVSLKAIKKILS